MSLTTTHHNELLERCLQGDQRAQMAIYDKYHKAMYNISFRIVKNPAEAEDVMQEAFLKAFSKLDSFKGDSTFGAWLKRIVVNMSITALKRSRSYEEVPFEDQLRKTEAETTGISETEAGANPKVKALLKAMDSLKDSYRLIISLHLIEGYDYEEICEIMNISPANCRTTISRAKESLRKKMMKL